MELQTFIGLFVMVLGLLFYFKTVRCRMSFSVSQAVVKLRPHKPHNHGLVLHELAHSAAASRVLVFAVLYRC